MSIFDHPEWREFERAICAEPMDDLPRLVAADWLDERAEACEACGGSGKGIGWGDYPDQFFRCPVCPPNSTTGYGIGTNGAAERAEYIRKSIELFYDTHTNPFTGNGKFSGLLIRPEWFTNPLLDVTAYYETGRMRNGITSIIILRRGFLDEIHCTLAEFNQHAGEIAKRHPVTKWVITDAEPLIHSNGSCTWWVFPQGTGGGDIGPDLFAAMSGRNEAAIMVILPTQESIMVVLPTREAAMQALADACYRVARQRAGITAPGPGVSDSILSAHAAPPSSPER